MPMMADDSDSSGLSEHSDKEIQRLAPVFLKAKKATKLAAPPPAYSPPRPKRPPSPPHEEVFADNPDIAFIVMFRSRFNDVLSSKLPHLGPQDVERGVMEGLPSPQVQQLLCALLALVLNRKKPVERGHHGRALEEAVQTQKAQWPLKWQGVNPLHGGKTFENMSPLERLNLLRTLVMWSLSSSEAVQTTLKEKYKQQRHNDDENQPLSVIHRGADGDKRRYFLIQGQDDTGFRVYREGHRYTKNAYWWSVAGDIDEVKELSKKLEEVDGTQAARRLAARMMNAIPVFEANEEKRRRREYRQERRAAFSRPEPGFSLYEGRTRGKRMRYTYDEDDSFLSDATSTRRSTRQQSTRNSPLETGPTFTASGRQIKQPRTGEYGESLLSGPPMSTDELAPGYSDAEGGIPGAEGAETEDSEQPVRGGARATRSRGRHGVNGAVVPQKRKHIDGYNDIDEMSDEEDADASGDEWDSEKNDDDDDDDEHMPDAEEDEDDEASEADDEQEEDEDPSSLVVKIRLSPDRLQHFRLKHEQNVVDAATKITEPEAPKCEQIAPSVNVKPESSNDMEPQTQMKLTVSSPLAASSYPTPTSSSFVPTEQKPVLPPSIQPVSQSIPETQGIVAQPNGLVHEAHSTTNSIPNGVQDRYSDTNGMNGVLH